MKLAAVLLLCFGLTSIESLSQEPIAGLRQPGDVFFEDPLEKFDFSALEVNPFSKVLFQDSKGFIWLVFQRTLYKYDGYKLTDFMEVPIGPKDLHASSVAVIVEDEFGYLWLGSHRKEGLFRYDPRRDTFERFPRNSNDPQEMSDAEVWTISPDGKGRVWIATREYKVGRGLYMYDYKTDRVKEYRHDPADPNSLPWDNIALVFADIHDNIWVNTLVWGEVGGRLYRFDPENEHFQEFRLNNPGGDPMPISTSYIQNDSLGHMYFCIFRDLQSDSTYPYLVRVKDNLEDIRYSSKDSIGLFLDYEVYPRVEGCNKFVFDQQGELWLQANEKGLIRFNLETRKVERYKPFISRANLVYFLGNVLKDASGAIWYSYVHDIRTHVPWKRKFTSYNPSYFQIPGMEEASVYSIYAEGDSVLWVGMEEYLIKHNRVTGKSVSFIPEPYHKGVRNRLQSILPGKEGQLYIAARNCFYSFDTSTEEFETIPYPDIYGGQFKIESKVMMQDRSGLIWIGVNPACVQIDLENKTAKELYGYETTEKFLGGITEAIVEDRNGIIWIGSEFGLNRYDPENDSCIKITHRTDRPEGLAAPNVRALSLDHEGNLWLGYKSNGVSCLDAKYVNQIDPDIDSLLFRHYSTADGLPDLHILDIMEDQSGMIWISSQQGLSRLDPGRGVITQFNKANGIHVDPFASNFAKSEPTGEIFIGGKGGLISFIPEEMPINTFVPPVVLTDFRLHNNRVAISDTSVLRQSITYTEKLDLSYRDNFLLFEFAALDYTDPTRNQYKYYMHGVDIDTVFTGTERTAEYRNLRPGHYEFWVSGSNSDGVWNPEGRKLDIRIHPPWYSSGLAWGLYILIVLLALVAFIRWRTERLKRRMLILENEVEKRTLEINQKNEHIVEIERLKGRFFTDISHEIRTPLSLITGPLDKLIRMNRNDDENSKWLGMVRRNSQRLLQLINQLLDISRLEAGQMKLLLEKGDVVRQLRMLSNEYYSLAESRGIRYIIDVPEREFTELYDKEKLNKITTNLLSNAFKFTPERGTITFRVRIMNGDHRGEHDKLRIIVADTGPGIPLEEQDKIFDRYYRAEGSILKDVGGSGVGLSLTKELVDLLHGEILVRSRKGSGSFFMATLPLGLNHLQEDEYIIKEADKEKATDLQSFTEYESDTEEDQSYLREVQILIVEDNEDLRYFLRENLSPMYNVVEAEDGLRGWDLTQSSIPDLVITDVMMPGMNGMELCGKLKGEESTHHIPVIMLTAKSTSTDKMEGLELGADDYIFKPFSMEELHIRIHNLLQQRERLRKKYSAMIGLDWGDMQVSTLDEEFLKRALSVITDNMHDMDFNVAGFTEKMNMDRTHLFRKLKALTGDSPSGLIRIMRLKSSVEFLRKGGDNITEIALNSGFSNSSHFARCFKQQYGVSPLEYRKELAFQKVK